MFTCLSNPRRFNSSEPGYCISERDSLLLITPALSHRDYCLHHRRRGIFLSVQTRCMPRERWGVGGLGGVAVVWLHLSDESHHRGRRTALASYVRRCNLILIHFPPLIRVLFQKAVYFPRERRRRLGLSAPWENAMISHYVTRSLLKSDKCPGLELPLLFMRHFMCYITQR